MSWESRSTTGRGKSGTRSSWEIGYVALTRPFPTHVKPRAWNQDVLGWGASRKDRRQHR
ncbi:MAG: hypothetical protein IIC72_12185 [Acidobacteria bacterium]|nr:hypothetical protein [Acidobacteriota bacterium]